ncbi:MAG: tetratricopeptide repeat protein [Crocinitomicaceae bacterium]
MLEDLSGQKIAEEFKSNKKLKMTTYIVGGILLLSILFFAYRQFIWKPANDDSKNSYWIGLNYAGMDSTNLAMEEFETAVNQYDGNIGGEVSQFLLGRQLMEQGEFEDALNELSSVNLKDTYLSSLVVKLQADCYSELKDYEKAANLYLEAAEINPNENTTPEILFSAGQCAEEINNFEKALECYQKIKDEYPSSTKGMSIEKYIARVEFKTIK